MATTTTFHFESEAAAQEISGAPIQASPQNGTVVLEQRNGSTNGTKEAETPAAMNGQSSATATVAATDKPVDRWTKIDENGKVVDLAPYEVLNDKEKKAIFFSLVVSMFLAALDQNIVIVALPTMVRDLGGQDLYAWVIASYMLTSAATMALYGRFSDVYGRRVIYLFAVGIFCIGSALSGAATSIWFLIISRGIQGIGGGGLMSLAMIIIGDIVQPSDRPKYISGMSSIFGVASIVAPLVGGAFTDKVSWRWVFYVNLPFGVTAFTSSFIAMKRFKLPAKDLALDVLGALEILCGVICIVLFTTWGGQDTGYPWNSGIIIGLIVAAAVLIALFIHQEWRHPLPILNLKLMQNWNFGLIMFFMFFAGMTMLGAFAYLPEYFQVVRGDTATTSGLKLIPLVFGFLFGAAIAGTVLMKTGQYAGLVPTGGALFTIGSGLLGIMTLTTNYGVIVVFELILGVGLGLIFPVTSTIVQNSVPLHEMANAMSAFTFFQTMGGAIGVSILGAILTKTVSDEVMNVGVQQAYVDGLTLLFKASCAPAGILFFSSLLIKKVDLHIINPAAGEAVIPTEPAKDTAPAGEKQDGVVMVQVAPATSPPTPTNGEKTSPTPAAIGDSATTVTTPASESSTTAAATTPIPVEGETAVRIDA